MPNMKPYVPSDISDGDQYDDDDLYEEPDEPDLCDRCGGTEAIRVDHGLFPGEFEYDVCPDCEED